MRKIGKTMLLFAASLLGLLCFGVGCEEQELPQSGCKEHAFGEWTTTEEASCFSDGAKMRVCQNCWETEYGVIPAPLTHSFGDWKVKKEAVCVKDGERVRVCEICETEERETIPAPGTHSFTEWIVTKKVGCFTDGERLHACLTCGELERETVPSPQQHTYGDWTTEREATCTVKGLLSRICGVCKAEETQETEINADKHRLSNTQSYTQTAHYTLCLDCKQKFNEGSHTFGEWTTTKPASYKEDGEKSRTCACSYQEKETLTRLPQETPSYQIPTLTCAYGSELDEGLPTGFALQEQTDVKTLSVGVHTLLLTYTVPGDTEGRYKTVTDIPVTLTVRKKEVAFTPDFSALSGLVYTGEPAPTPSMGKAYAKYATVTWYQGDRALTGAPKLAGEYTAVVRFSSEQYTAGENEWSFAFTIAKNHAMLGGYEIADRYYTGEPFTVNAKEIFGESTAIVWKQGGELTAAPYEVGEYVLEISIAETENYFAQTRSYTVRILEDTVPPEYEEYLVYVTDSLEYEFRATDNAKIAYYQYYRSPDGSWQTTADAAVVLENGEEYVVVAVDASGNQSAQWLVYTRIPTKYAPKEHSPAKGAVVEKSYVELFATGAKTYYFGTVKNELLPTNTPFVDGLVDGMTYYWRASDGVEESETYSFTVSNPSLTQGVELLSPADGAVINDSAFYLVATSQSEIVEYYYQREGVSYWDTSNDGRLRRLDYGMKYFWYAKDKDGNVSATRSFTYVYGESLNPEGITIQFPTQRVSYINRTNCFIIGSSIAEARYIRCYQSSEGRYLAENFDYEKDGSYYLVLRGLEHGEIVYFTMTDGNLSWGAYYTLYVDLEAPVLGEATGTFDGAWRLVLPTATDTFGVDTYYRLNYGEWTLYDGALPLSVNEKTCVLELKAVDKAGNETYDVYSFGEEPMPPALELLSGKLDEWTNTDVTVSVTPLNGFTTYFWNGEELVLVEERTEFTFKEEKNVALYTAILGADGEWIYSEPSWLMIDKTAPVVGELLYRKDRFNLNTNYEFILIDEWQMQDQGSYKIYYKFRNIDKNWIEMTKGRMPLYAYIITVSGDWFVDIKAVDEAGNESEIKTATILLDAESPTVGEVKVDRTYDEATGKTKTVIQINDIVDDYGYFHYVNLLITDTDRYYNNKEELINIKEYFEEGKTSYSYDVSYLPQGVYFFAILIADNYDNPTQGIFCFNKYDFETTVTVGDYKFYQTETENVLFLYNGEEEQITLPKSVNGEEYSIAARFLAGNEEVTFVRVSEGATKMGEEAFYFCKSLKEVVLPKSLKEIGVDFGEESAIKAVYYEGTQEEWLQIKGNENVQRQVYYYSETEKEGCWRYVNGKPTLWTVAE